LTSALTVGEILVKPIQSNRQDLVSRYQDFFQRPVFRLSLLIWRQHQALQRFAKTRGSDLLTQFSWLVPPADIDLFVANDDRLSQFHVQGIHFITGLDQAPI
jgi:hypothetical protein